MLRVENLAEAISFLPLCDLDSVLLANRQLSSTTSKCVNAIRIWYFEHVDLWLNGKFIARGADEGETQCESAKDTVLPWSEESSESREHRTVQCTLRVSYAHTSRRSSSAAEQVSALHIMELDLYGTDSDRKSPCNVIARFRKVRVRKRMTSHPYCGVLHTLFSPSIFLSVAKYFFLTSF